MGSPISPLLADLFMGNMEKKIINSANFRKILFWYRYVDDIFACFVGSRIELLNFLEYLNNIHPKIKFTLEEESNRTINFLDLTIKRTDDQLNFSIYRKPTHTDATIPYNSFHPINHKLAAYNSMVHRALSLPLGKDKFEQEISVIKQIAFNNGYNISIINNILKKKLYCRTVESIFPKDNNKITSKYLTTTYFGNISKKLSKVIQHKDIKVAFRSTPNLSLRLFNSKEKENQIYKSGIYKLACKFCDSVYIGQTSRAFITRYNEHISAFRNKRPERSNFAKHLIEQGHKLGSDSRLRVLHYCTVPQELNFMEALEIKKHIAREDCTVVNEQTDLKNSLFLDILI